MKYIFVLIVILFFSCDSDHREPSFRFASSRLAEGFLQGKETLDKSYWYAGKAEVSRYSLEQNRYKDLHPGEVVFIFVTEDFLTDRQVKNDQYKNPNSISVLKTNQIRRFTTGLYDYSMMTSVFTPAKGGPSLKVTMGAQDWCGQSFMQLNRKRGGYDVELRSYFESEGDKNFHIKSDILEDEIANLIRINPRVLPTAKLNVVPSLVSLRLSHDEARGYEAVASHGEYEGDLFSGEGLKEYTLQYTDLDRLVSWVYEAKKPYRIVGWTETRPSAFDKVNRTTVARKTNEVRESYWTKNDLSQTATRSSLGLKSFD